MGESGDGRDDMGRRDAPGPDDVVVPYMFVPEGTEPDRAWLAAHPGWFKIPALAEADLTIDGEAPDADPPLPEVNGHE